MYDHFGTLCIKGLINEVITEVGKTVQHYNFVK